MHSSLLAKSAFAPVQFIMTVVQKSAHVGAAPPVEELVPLAVLVPLPLEAFELDDEVVVEPVAEVDVPPAPPEPLSPQPAATARAPTERSAAIPSFIFIGSSSL